MSVQKKYKPVLKTLKDINLNYVNGSAVIPMVDSKGKRCEVPIHDLMVPAFLDINPEVEEVIHLNGNKMDHDITNYKVVRKDRHKEADKVQKAKNKRVDKILKAGEKRRAKALEKTKPVDVGTLAPGEAGFIKKIG